MPSRIRPQGVGGEIALLALRRRLLCGAGGLCASVGELTITQDSLGYAGCTPMCGNPGKGEGGSDRAGYRSFVKEVVFQQSF